MNQTLCGFAYPGTYGHECGKPAVWVGLKKSDCTKNRVFYARRCDECRQIKGGENADVYDWKPFDPVAHKNQWK